MELIISNGIKFDLIMQQHGTEDGMASTFDQLSQVLYLMPTCLAFGCGKWRGECELLFICIHQPMKSFISSFLLIIYLYLNFHCLI